MRYGDPYPRAYGGGKSIWRQEIDALLDAYAQGWDRSDTSQSTAEVHAVALAVATVWAVNRRAANRLIPSRMLESLSVYEVACRTNPQPGDTLRQRRNAVAARLLGFAGNAITQIYDVCSTIGGSAFLGLVLPDPSTAISYMPGIHPGPPGFEWCSTLAAVAVSLSRTGLPDAAFLDIVRRLRVELALLCPSWMTFQVGSSDGGFVPGVGVVGVSLL